MGRIFFAIPVRIPLAEAISMMPDQRLMIPIMVMARVTASFAEERAASVIWGSRPAAAAQTVPRRIMAAQRIFSITINFLRFFYYCMRKIRKNDLDRKKTRWYTSTSITPKTVGASGHKEKFTRRGEIIL